MRWTTLLVLFGAAAGGAWAEQQEQEFPAFSADYVETSNAHIVDPDRYPEPVVIRGRYVRDREGRVRQEDWVEIGAGKRRERYRVVIADQTVGISYELQADQKLAVSAPIPKRRKPGERAKQPVTPPPAGVKAPRYEFLGTRQLQGFQCRGSRMYLPGDDSYMETWWCPEIGYPAEMTVKEPTGIVRVKRWYNFKLGIDPDPDQFQVPDDFTIVDRRTQPNPKCCP